MSILTQSQAGRLAGPAGAGPQLDLSAPRDGRSYVAGDGSSPLRFATIPETLRDTVSRHGARDAVVLPRERKTLSYYDLDREVDAVACGLLALGLDKGDRIGIWSPNRLEWILAQFATARFGAVLVNINPAYRPGELEYALNAVGCKALITAEAFKSSRYLDMIRALAPELERCEPGRLVSARLPHLRIVVAMSDDPGPGMFRFSDVRQLGGPAQALRLEAVSSTLDPDDPINIQFTSGTTGSPKGATLTHYNIVNNARIVTDRMCFTEHDRLCIPVPLYHCFGMVMGSLGCVTQGAAMVFPGEGFDAADTLRAISQARCTALYGVPTMFVAMLAEMGKAGYDLSSLRTGIMAGTSCPIEVMQRVIDEMHMSEVTIAYGMTETSPVSFQCFVDDPIEQRVATVGRILPHLEAKVVDGEGAMVPVGESGELCIRGYSVMRGYWGDEERTRESIVGGWMHSGDLASFDEDGFCRIVGRVKDMIIRGGEKRLSARSRGLSVPSPCNSRGAGVRHPGCEVRRAGLRVGGAPRGGGADAGGGDWVLRRRDRALQGAEACAHGGRVADDGDGEAAEVRDAGVDGEGGVRGRGAEGLIHTFERRHQPSFLRSRIRRSSRLRCESTFAKLSIEVNHTVGSPRVGLCSPRVIAIVRAFIRS